jgi:hypothetical protein
MVYLVEQWDGVQLNFTTAPYLIPTDPLALDLNFESEPSVEIPPLPWKLPTVTVEYVAILQIAGVSAQSTIVPLGAASPADDVRSVLWGAAAYCDFESRTPFSDATFRDNDAVGVWGTAQPLHGSNSAPWQQSTPKDVNCVIQWGGAQIKDRIGYVSSWVMNTPARDAIKGLPWYSVNLTGTLYDDAAARLAVINTDTATTISLDGFSGSIKITPADKVSFSFGYVQPKRPVIPHDVTTRLTARQAAPRDAHRALLWGVGQSAWQDWNLPYPVEPNPVDPPDPINPPVRKIVYLIMNTLQITDIATGAPLDIQGVNISIDIDSLSWKFSGTVYGEGTLNLVRPDESGMKDISVTINTHEWVFSIERYTSDEKFPTSKFSISGVSRTQYMAAPFAPVRSYTNAIATTAAQVANAELENTGFTLVWPTSGDGDLPDWIIPTGALSYRDKTPAQVVAQVVTAAGGVMIPSMAADSWTVQPRYKSSPWQWDLVVPDTAIYIGMVRSRSARYEPAPAYDSCFVSGISQGVSVDVQRQGSGGLNPMPDVLDDLITAAAPAISRGRNELAATGNKVVESLSVLIPEQGAAPGILKPGQIIKVTHDNSASDYVGLVLANSISVQRAGGAEIYQSVTLERSA